MVKNNNKILDELTFKKLDELKSWEHWYTENEKQEIEKKSAKNFKPVCIVDSTAKHLELVRKYKNFARSLEKEINEIITVNTFEEKSCGLTRTIFFATPELEKALKRVNFKPLVNYLKREIKTNETKNIVYSSNLYSVDDESLFLILSSDTNKAFNHIYNPEEAKKISQENEYKEIIEWINQVGTFIEIKEYLEKKQKEQQNNDYKKNSTPENNSQKQTKPNNNKLPEHKRTEKLIKNNSTTTQNQYNKKKETKEKRKERYQREKEKEEQKISKMTQEELEEYIRLKREKSKAEYERHREKIKEAYQGKKEAFKQLSEEEQEKAKAKEHERRKREYQSKKAREQEKFSQMTEEEIAKFKEERSAKQHEYYVKRKNNKLYFNNKKKHECFFLLF